MIDHTFLLDFFFTLYFLSESIQGSRMDCFSLWRWGLGVIYIKLCMLRLWRIPWTEEPGRLQSRVAQSQTWLKRLSTNVCSDFPGEGNGNPLQYSCLENPMDRGAWWATVHGVAKSQTRLSDFTFMLRLKPISLFLGVKFHQYIPLWLLVLILCVGSSSSPRMIEIFI